MMDSEYPWGSDPYALGRPQIMPPRGPYEQIQGLKDGSITRVVGEVLKRGCMQEFTDDTIRVITEPHLRGIIVKMARELVAFEQPAQTSVTTREVEAATVPLTWWDHVKYTFPFLTQRLWFKMPRTRTITTVINTYVEKHYVCHPRSA